MNKRKLTEQAKTLIAWVFSLIIMLDLVLASILIVVSGIYILLGFAYLGFSYLNLVIPVSVNFWSKIGYATIVMTYSFLAFCAGWITTYVCFDHKDEPKQQRPF